MLTAAEAQLILDHSEPLLLHAESPHPMTPNYICISPDALADLGIKESQLTHYAGGAYDGMDYLNGLMRVHVFEKDKLERLVTAWSKRVVREAMTHER